MKKPLSWENTWKRIRGMRLKGCEGAQLPSALGGRVPRAMNRDPEPLDKWFDKDPDG
jgi:hypothetical protein